MTSSSVNEKQKQPQPQPQPQPQLQKHQQTGSYPDIVYALEPLLQFSIYFLQLIRWKEGLRRRSLLLTLSWTLVCHHYYFFAITAPLWLILSIYHSNNDKAKNKMLQTTPLTYERVTDELRDIQIELDIFLSFYQDNFRKWKHQLLSSRKQLTTTALPLILFWMTCVAFLGLRTCVWFLGFLVLSWKSPLFMLTRHAYHRAILIYQHRHTSPIEDVLYAPMKSSPGETDRYFCFTVIEHQRWWPLSGWTTTLLPNDRPEWSDIYHHRVPSIGSFKLPPPSTNIKKINNNEEVEVKIKWKWATSDWQIEKNQRSVDQDGWEYGGWDWKFLGDTARSSGLQVLTRRRHWVRTAHLSEIQKKTMPINIMSRSNSLSTITTASSCSSVSTTNSSYMDLIPSLSNQPQIKSMSTVSNVSTLHHHLCNDPFFSDHNVHIEPVAGFT